MISRSLFTRYKQSKLQKKPRRVFEKMTTFFENDRCIFCKIVKGEIPAICIADDKHCKVIMDVRPLSRGHCLVITKNHYEKLHEVNAETAQSLAKTLVKTCSAFKKCDYNVLQNNGPSAFQTIPHVHFHVIPQIDGDGLQLGWNPTGQCQRSLEKEAKRIAAHFR